MYFFGGVFVEDVCLDSLYYGIDYCVCSFLIFIQLSDFTLHCILIGNVFFEMIRVIVTYEMMRHYTIFFSF